jgi:hypothetical protein
MTILVNHLPLVCYPKVFHVGSLNAQDKGRAGNSYEGNGLSVSLHPEEWTQIARLGGGQTFQLTKPTGSFLDTLELSPDWRQAFETQAFADGWLTPAQRWRIEWFDGDTEERVHTFLKNEEAARAELQGFGESAETGDCRPVQVPIATAQLTARIGFEPDDLDATALALTCWVEDHTRLDGLWWHERLNVDQLSAPRGVINLRSLSSWAITPVRE